MSLPKLNKITIDEAIEELSKFYEPKAEEYMPDTNAAIRLGIEALKWIKWRRQNYRRPPVLPLPGEAVKCPGCGGGGKVSRRPPLITEFGLWSEETCSRCDGKGWIEG